MAFSAPAFFRMSRRCERYREDSVFGRLWATLFFEMFPCKGMSGEQKQKIIRADVF